MSVLRVLARLFLVLALLVGGVASGAASAAGAGDDAPMSVSCHDLAGDAVEPAADCCDDGGCTCDCLHHTPVGFLPAALLPRLAVLGVNQDRLAAVPPMATGAPEIRPPIA